MSGGDYLNRDWQMERMANIDNNMAGEVTVKELTDERGANYGHPYDHFQCTQDMFAVWEGRRGFGEDIGSHEAEKCLNHIVYLICDKLTRAAQNPLHLDNFDDIQGYASLFRKCLEREAE